MTMAIVGLQDAHHLMEEAVIILPMVEGCQEGTGPGHPFIRLMVALKESMFGALGEAVCYNSVTGRKFEVWKTIWQPCDCGSGVFC